MTEIGFLGIGRMGTAIAGRMLDAGLRLRVWNRSQTSGLAELLASGATLAQSPADALAAPVSFSMLADDAAADSVLSTTNFGATDIPRIHVNMASVSVRMADHLTRRFAEAGVWYVSAPVLGRPEVAAEGKLDVLLAGPEPALDEIDPLLAPCSARRWRLGGRPRQANAVKIALNFMLLQALQSIGEGITLAEGEGVDATMFADLFSNSFFGGVEHSYYGEIIAERRYSPAVFSIELGRKDLTLAEQLAAELELDLPTIPALRQQYETALADPALAGLDWAAIAEVTRRQVER